MTKEQIEQKAKNVYMRCFDDDFEYTGVLHALEICAEETATEATKELEEKLANADYQLEGRDNEIRELEAQIEQMKCPQNCRYSAISVWCDNSISIDCEKEKYLHEENWCDFCKNCKKWEIKEK